MITIEVDPFVRRQFPELSVLWFEARGIDSARLAAIGETRLREAAELTQATFPSTAELLADHAVAAWRDAYRAIGLKPSNHRCSYEALARRAVAGRLPVTGLGIVNLYNAASLRFKACIGAYDVHRLASTHLQMRRCRPHVDTFVPIGGDPADFPLTGDLIVYAQANEVLCWAFNCRDSARACLTPTTTTALFSAEGVIEAHRAHATAALEALRSDLALAGAEVSQIVWVCRGETN